MKRITATITVALLILLSLGVTSALADGGEYTVQAGDTLASIAANHGTSVRQLARANGLNWNSWVYTGQRLTIPGQSRPVNRDVPAITPATVSNDGTYTVRFGDTLNSIAHKYGISLSALQSANDLTNANHIYTGQKLVIPGGHSNQVTNYTTAPAASGSDGKKWIDVNLSTQTMTAYEGQTPVLQRFVSTGTQNYPTIVGTFNIYHKNLSQRMFGGSGADYYDIPNVPHVMYFYGGYGFHGTYWHSNFGTPMSHGCVNLSLDDAAWLYDWAPIGTEVVTHY